MSRIFISHSSENNEKAIEVRDWLAKNGWDDIFLDFDPERGITAGQRWKEELRKANSRCEVVLALISKEWLESDWCKSEVHAASMMGKKVIAALVGIDKSAVPVDLTDEQFIDLTGDPEAYRRLKEGLKRAGLDPTSFHFEPGRRPYPGFAYLVEEDAAVFFGREAQIVRCLDALRRLANTGVTRMLVILGASGSGKSSFLRAGLWSRLKRDDRAWLPLPIIRPERAAISGKYGLAAALSEIVSEPRFAEGIRGRGLPRSRIDIQDFIEKTDDGLAKLLAALREIAQAGFTGESAPPPTVLLAIDQGEELFNEESRDEARRFIEILKQTLEADPRTIAILVVRSDAFPQVQSEQSLAALSKDTFPLDTMLEGSFRTVIEGPARLVEPPLTIDPQLTDALLEDISGQDALPLLAFHLYDNTRADNKLTLDGYAKIGRVKGVIDQTVAQAFRAAVDKGEAPKTTEEQYKLARSAFIPHLVQFNPAAGQFVRRVAPRIQIPEEAWPLIDRFVEQRLLIKDWRQDAEVIEVAHEALLRQPPFSDWLADDREFLVWRERLTRERTAFEAEGRGLLVDRELAIARSHMQTRAEGDIERRDLAFIRDSIAADDKRQADEAEAQRKRAAAEKEEQERRIRDAERIANEQKKVSQRTRIGLCAALLLLGAAGWQWWLAETRTMSALIESSDASFNSGETWDALMSSLRAVKLFRSTPFSDYFDRDIQSRLTQSLQQSIYAVKEYKRLAYNDGGPFQRQSTMGQLAWRPGGEDLAILSSRFTVGLWNPDRNTYETIDLRKSGAQDSEQIQAATWMPPGDQTLVTTSVKDPPNCSEVVIREFDTRNRDVKPTIPFDDVSCVYGIGWSPDGTYVALPSFTSGVYLLGEGKSLPNPLAGLGPQVWVLAWSPGDSHTLAAGGFSGSVMLKNLDDGSPPCSQGMGGWVTSMSWRPDGQMLAVGSNNGSVRLLSRNCSGETPLQGHSGFITGVSWSNKSRLATAGQEDRTVKLWDKDGTLLATLQSATTFGGVQWRPVGQVLATLDPHRLIRHWRDNALVKTFTHRANTINDASMSPDGEILAIATNIGVELRQKGKDGWPSEPIHLGVVNNEPVQTVKWSPKGDLLAYGNFDSVSIWNRARGPDRNTGKIVNNGISTMSWSPDGKEIAVGARDTNLTLLSVSDLSVQYTHSCGDWVESVAWNPADEGLLAMGCHNTAGAFLLKWQRETKELSVAKKLIENAWVYGTDWSADGNTLATTSNGAIQLWDRDVNKSIPPLSRPATTSVKSPGARTAGCWRWLRETRLNYLERMGAL